MKSIPASLQQTEALDGEFFYLFFSAVALGLNLVRDLEKQKTYFGNHLSFHRLFRVEGQSIPKFTSAGLKDYSAAFGEHPDSLIKWRDHPEIVRLVEYALSTQALQKHFRTVKFTLAGETYELADAQVESSFIHLYAGTVDMCAHKLIQDNLSPDWFRPWYRYIERAIFDRVLRVDVVVPITGLSFDFETRWLVDSKIAIFRMGNEFQEARFLEQQFDIKIPSPVSGFASHAFILKDRTISNDGHPQYWREAQKLVKKETHLINSLFGLLKAATGEATGYAQVVVNPVMWSDNFVAHLPSVFSESVRAYPTSFDEGIWRAEPSIVLSSHLDSISSILTKSGVIANKKLRLAISRLNSCLLRDNKEDKILDACIGLEALFSDDTKQELTHKLALRIAAISHLFERGQYLKREVFKAVKTIYGYRSTVVHGGSPKPEEAFVSISGHDLRTDEFAIDILREAIIALGKHSTYLDPQRIDYGILLNSPDE